jgi:hypothetical protein
MKIIAGLPSIPDRVEALKRTVESIYPQVDRLFVELNGYDCIPEFLIDTKIHAEILDNSLGSPSRFMHLKDTQQYFFGIDDDLIYPKGYVEYMIEGILRYDAIVTLHGKIYPRPVTSLRKYKHKYACLGDVNNDYKVEVGGAGCMAFDINRFNFDISIFGYPNMGDIFVSREAHRQGVGIYVLKHSHDYLKYMKPKWTIYGRKTEVTRETAILQSFLK